MGALVTLKTLTVLATGVSFDLNPADGAYQTLPPDDGFLLGTGAVNATTTERFGRWPSLAGVTRQVRQPILSHVIDPFVGGGLEENKARLKALYDPKHGECELEFTMNGHDMTARVLLLRMFPHSSGVTDTIASGQWTILSDTYYSADGDSGTSSVAAVAKSASPATLQVTNAGTVDSRKLSITLEPTVQKAAADGQRFMRHVLFINRSTFALSRHPVELTGGGWNHAAAVAAAPAESRSDGNDVEAYVNGVREPVWDGAGTSAFDSATTKLWCAIDAPAGREFEHSGSALGGGGTSFDTDSSLDDMPALPFFAAFYDVTNGHEQVLVTAYEARDGGGGTLTIVRAQRSTGSIAHDAGTSLWWTPVLPDIVYGWTSAPAPMFRDDDVKPIPAEHQDSGNSAWTFALYAEPQDTDRVDALKPRPGSWYVDRKADWIDREDMFTDWVPPAVGTSITALEIEYQTKGAKPGRPLVDRWAFRTPVSITRLRFSEDTTGLTSPGPSNFGQLILYVTTIDGTEYELGAYSDSSTSPDETLDPGVIRVAFAIAPWDPTLLRDNTIGSDTLIAQEPADGDDFTIAANLIADFGGDDALLVAMQDEEDAYQFGRPDAPATIANDLDGIDETMEIRGLVVPLNTTVTIDVDARTLDIGSEIPMTHVRGGAWPELPADAADVPHDSDLTYTETGIGTVEIGVPEYRGAWN